MSARQHRGRHAGADPAAGYLWEGLPSPYTALTGALTSGHAEPHRQTALHGAAFRGDLAMVKYLIGHGADPAAEDCSFHATALG